MSLTDYLQNKGIKDALAAVVFDAVKGFLEIYGKIGFGNEGYLEHENIYGEKQAKLDVLANEILVDRLSKNGAVALIASEELDEAIKKDVKDESFCVVFDPLDGSSVSDSNMTVGTILAVYGGSEIIGKTGRNQLLSMLAVYGPKFSFYLAHGSELAEFIFDQDKNEFVLLNDTVKIDPESKYFAPGGLNMALEEGWYHEALHYWLGNGYKLRYSGSMAADINHILKKKGGLYLYPGGTKNRLGKLRLLYECSPVAMIIENAGGRASNGEKSILDIQIESLNQTEPFFVGSKNEVKRMEAFLKEKQSQTR